MLLLQQFLEMALLAEVGQLLTSLQGQRFKILVRIHHFIIFFFLYFLFLSFHRHM